MIHVIPYPNICRELGGAFILTKESKIQAEAFEAEAALFSQMAADAAAFSLEQTQAGGQIRFCRVEGLGPEAYRLACTPESICVEASEPAGAFYAVQTLRQLFRLDAAKPGVRLVAPCVEIEDAPRFGWRGLMLDESRHFFGAQEVKRLLDQMAFYKLNRFHWHLTDDNGWRIESKAYPLLTQIGAKRSDTQIHGWTMADREGKPHEGFYTREQLRELVAYAAERHIMVIPEIDMPAHFRAAIAAYPWLACREIESEVPWYFATPEKVPNSKAEYARIACAGKESTYTFIETVVGELCELFDAPYFHIGGDEAPKDEWKKCPHCQSVIREQGLRDESALQCYFNNRIASFLKERGKQLICWNDGLHTDGGADTEIIGQYYTNGRDKLAEAHLNRGGSLILSRYRGFYFDMSYAELPLKVNYTYPILHEGITKKNVARVLGVEGALWTEWVASREKIDMNLHPRMETLAEHGWTEKAPRGYKGFLKRWNGLRPLLDAKGIGYADERTYCPPRALRKKTVGIWYGSDPCVEVARNRAYRSQEE